MNTVQSLLLDPKVLVFSTREFARVEAISVSSASHRLVRLKKKGFIQLITRGLWVKATHPYFSPLSCVPYLLGDEQGYVSFYTALHHHGLISQIPLRIHIATTGHGRLLKTAFAVYEFFQMHPRMMLEGVDWSQTQFPYRLATPEKALLDCLYLGTRKSKRFSSIPALDVAAKSLKPKAFKLLLQKQVPMPQLQKAIKTKAHVLIPSTLLNS